jgi:hypothetical protein
MCTGVGGAPGLALLAASGALLSGGVSVATQKHDTGHVDWGQVGVDAAVGAAGQITSRLGCGLARTVAANAVDMSMQMGFADGVQYVADSWYQDTPVTVTGLAQATGQGLVLGAALGTAAGVTQHLTGVTQFACFTGDTPVAMADGTAKPIRDVGVGDQVLTVDLDSGSSVARPVTDTFTHADTPTLVVVTSAGQITTTSGHPFHVDGHGFTPAGRLQPGDRLRAPDGTVVTVQEIRPTGQTVTVHNFEVAETHTYPVIAGDTPILVHNDCTVEGLTSNAARREAMREAGIPTSQQPVEQIKTESGYTYVYETPVSGGGTGLQVVSQGTTDFYNIPAAQRPPGHGPHWEAGVAKIDKLTGLTTGDSMGRPRIYNGTGTDSPKVKVWYDG